MTTIPPEIVYWHWLALGVLLVTIEVVAPGVLFLWLGMAAGATGLVLLVLPALTWEIQFLVFAALSIVSVYLGRRLVRRSQKPTDHPILNRRAKRHVGQTFTLESATVDGRGRMRVADSTWSVVVEGGGDIAAGAKVRVVGVQGSALRISNV